MKSIFKKVRLTSVLLAMTLWAFPAHGQSLTAAADESSLWILMPEHDRPEVFTVYHHALGDPPSQINKVQALRGEVRPHRVASRDHSLWIIYPDGAVQVIRAEPSPLQDGWVYRQRVEPRLPSGASVRAMALTQTGPWVLVRIEDQQSLSAIDALEQPSDTQSSDAAARRQRNLAIGLPPRHGTSAIQQQTPTTQATTPSEIEPPPAEDATADNIDPVDIQPVVELPETALPVDRLLYLEHGRWRTHPLPQDWPHGAEARLLAERKQNDRPTLTARENAGSTQLPETISVYHSDAEPTSAWSNQVYPVQNNEADGIELLAVENQLVLAQHVYQRGQLSATLSVLRDGKALPVDTMSLDDVSATPWCILSTGNAAALVAHRSAIDLAAPDPGGLAPLIWTQLDVRGNTVLEPTKLLLKTRSAMDDLAQYIMLAFVVILITVLMLAFWRRDAAWNRLDLPDDVVVADLVRRAAAAAIDMAPGLLAAMAYFDLSFEELMLRWPGNGVAHSAEQMLPGAVVIAVFVTHTTLVELFLARSLGKTLTGLRTATLTGTRPRAWQLLVRGLLKSLDLLPWAWLLLLLPVIAPHRQRLGDLVGRTVVISDAPPPPDEDSGADDSV